MSANCRGASSIFSGERKLSASCHFYSDACCSYDWLTENTSVWLPSHSSDPVQMGFDWYIYMIKMSRNNKLLSNNKHDHGSSWKWANGEGEVMSRSKAAHRLQRRHADSNLRCLVYLAQGGSPIGANQNTPHNKLKAVQSWNNRASLSNHLLQISAGLVPSEMQIMWQTTNKAIREMLGKTGKQEKDLNTD